jgi:hypothetical protein
MYFGIGGVTASIENFDFDDLEACLVAIAMDLDLINLIIMVTIIL